MASTSKDPNGNRTIQFVAADGKRRSIRLGKLALKAAESIKGKIEALNAARLSNLPLDPETAAWVGKLGDNLADKLANADLIPHRGVGNLGAFVADYIDGRTDAKESTRVGMKSALQRVVKFLGANRRLDRVTPADADALVVHMKAAEYSAARLSAGR